MEHSRRLVWTAVLIPSVAWLLSLVAAAADRDLFWALSAEDGPVEWLQFLFLLAGVALAAWTASRLARIGETGWSAVYWLGAFVLLFLCAEEISWGQRVFGWQTPDWLDHNMQEESNLHNLPQLSVLFAWAAVLVPLAVAVASLVLWPHRDRLSRYRPHLWLPHPVVTVSLICFLSYGLIRWFDLWYFGLEQVHSRISRLQEPAEAILYFGGLVFLAMAGAQVQSAGEREKTRREPPSRRARATSVAPRP